MEILINPSKEVFLTKDEFEHLSFYGISAFFINYKACVSRLENDDFKIYTNQYDLAIFSSRNYRFKNMSWYKNEAAEFYHCTVTDQKLKQTIEKYFLHKFLK